MGQAEILDFLKLNKGSSYSEREISERLNISRCKRALKSLRKAPPNGFFFKRVRNKTHHWTFVYKWGGY